MNPGKTRLTEIEQVDLQALMKKTSPTKVAKRWGLADQALLRAANGYLILRGTKALIEAGLAKDKTEGEQVKHG